MAPSSSQLFDMFFSSQQSVHWTAGEAFGGLTRHAVGTTPIHSFVLCLGQLLLIVVSVCWLLASCHEGLQAGDVTRLFGGLGMCEDLGWSSHALRFRDQIMPGCHVQLPFLKSTLLYLEPQELTSRKESLQVNRQCH